MEIIDRFPRWSKQLGREVLDCPVDLRAQLLIVQIINLNKWQWFKRRSLATISSRLLS